MTIEQYKDVISTYKEFYPEDRLDIMYHNSLINSCLSDNPNPDDIVAIQTTQFRQVSFTVYFPKVTVTNEKKQSHDITDVYVNVAFPDMTIRLGRTSYTQEEINVGYVHSHTHMYDFTNMSNFCTGRGPINTIINNIKQSILTGDAFKLLIESFIIEVERMIKVESLEGGPYIQLSSVGKNITGNSPITVVLDTYPLQNHSGIRASYTNDIKRFFLYYASLMMDSFYYDGQNWQLDCSDFEFIRRVTKAAKTFKAISKKSTLFYDVYVLDGLYYQKSDRERHLGSDAKTFWTFKGKFMHITIRNENKPMKIVSILKPGLINKLYTFLLTLINSVYANDIYKDCIHARAYKVANTLIKQL